jgi:hypothetical protein
MSAGTFTPSLTAAPRAGGVRRPSFALLTAVELRKAVDTRAGRVLLAGMLLLSVATLGYLLATAKAGTLEYAAWVRDSTIPVALLLPVLGVLATASEWTQRTALTTFTLTPRRGRVLGAKLLAAVTLGLVVTVLVEVLAAGAVLLRAAVVGGPVVWTDLGPTLAGSVVAAGLALLMGAAMGALVQQSAGAIVAYFAAPSAVVVAGAVLFGDRAEWIDVNGAFERISSFDLDGHLAPSVTAVLLWVGLPLVFGVLRSLRRDVS